MHILIGYRRREVACRPSLGFASLRASLALLTSVLLPGTALAGGYLIPTENARDLALSQAAVAAQNGPEATFHNAAALAGQEGLAFSGSIEFLDNGTSWSDPVLGSASTETHVNIPPAISFAYGNKFSNGMPYGLGFNFQVPGGGSLFWPYNWAGATRIQSVEQRGFLSSFGVGIQPIDGIKIGARAGLYRVTERLVQQINYIAYPANATLGLAGWGPTFGVSGEFHLPSFPQLKLGVDYLHKSDLTLEGSGHFASVPPTFAPALQDQDAKERVTLPNVFYVGAAYSVIPELTLMFAWNLEVWTVYKSDTFIGSKGFMISVPRNYNDAWVYRLAAEWAHPSFLPALTLRLSGLRSISDQPTDTISPTLSDGNSWAFALGAGYDVTKSLRADIAWQHAIFDSVTATGTEAFPGTYKTVADLISVGVTYRMSEL
jgi:long-chain fatty acid transport protein